MSDNNENKGILGSILDAGKAVIKLDNDLTERADRALHLLPQSGQKPNAVQVLVEKGRQLSDDAEKFLHVYPGEAKNSGQKVGGRAAAPAPAVQTHPAHAAPTTTVHHKPQPHGLG